MATAGFQNTFLGHQSGFSNTSGTNNIFFGHQSGYNNTGGIGNLFFGNSAGLSNKGGNYNIFIGNNSGEKNVSGSYNMFIGLNSGKDNLTGIGNTFVGWNSGLKHQSGDNNIIFGFNAANFDVSGQNNVIIGARAGEYDTNHNNNVLIGYLAGRNETADNRLVIANNETKNLIYGDFASDWLIINNKLGINVGPSFMGSQALNVNGTFKLGSKGSTLNEIIKGTISNLGLGDISGDSSAKFTVSVEGTAMGATVSISPRTELPDGLVVSYARVVSAGNVEVKLQNTKSSTLNVSTGTVWDVTIIQ
jgi:hypothetical protein